MNNKFTTVSKGTSIISSVNQNTFTFTKSDKTFSFTPHKKGASTPITTDKISLQNRREYHYYVKT